MSTARGGSRQAELFPRSKKPIVTIQDNHPQVWLTDRLDWTELEELVEGIRRHKLTSPAGRPPHLRALIGAVILQARRKMPYRELKDQIRHYAPARGELAPSSAPLRIQPTWRQICTDDGR